MDLRRFMVLEPWKNGIYGGVIFLTIAMALVHSLWWLLPNALVGINFAQQAITGWCPVTFLLHKAGFA